MDLSKLSNGDKVIGGSGIALFVFSFFPWFTIDAAFIDYSESGWDYFFTGIIPTLLGVALVALFFAWRRIYRQAAACKPGEVCAIPQVRATYKLIFWIVAALVLVALGFPYVMPFFY